MTKPWVFGAISVVTLLAIGVAGMAGKEYGISLGKTPRRTIEKVKTLLPFTFSPFPHSEERELNKKASGPPLDASLKNGIARLYTLTDAGFIRPMSLEILARELRADIDELRALETWTQAKWEEYQKNPEPQLESLKQKLEKRFYTIYEKTLGFSPFNPPKNQTSLTDEQLERLRKTIIEDSQTQEFKALEEKLISFDSIPDEIQSKHQLINLDRSGKVSCVSPNTCYRQGGIGGSGNGTNTFAPCCNCRILYFPIGCLNLICPPPKAAIYDYCTGTCGCNL